MIVETGVAHGGSLILKSILGAITAAGSRLAEPGEFTKRAFLNGRIDLSQAEAVADIISAKTEAALKIGLEQLEGKLSNKIKEVKGDLTEILAQMEANIDYAEEKLETMTRNEVVTRIKNNKAELEKLIETYDKGKIIKEGIRVAIIGKPNVGKSSLLNCLLREEKAIVTELPGTTRDIVEDVISIKGHLIRLMDTAGLRSSNNKIEKIGQERTKRAIEKADILLWVVDGNRPLSKEDKAIGPKLIGKNYIAILNKRDLPAVIKGPELKALGVDKAIGFSALKGTGLGALEQAIIKQALKSRVGGGLPENSIITSQRHFLALKQAIKRLAEALIDAGRDAGEEFIAPNLRASIENLGEITGERIGEDVLNIIFSRFCIGK